MKRPTPSATDLLLAVVLRLQASIIRLHRKVDFIMGTEQELKDDLDAIKAGVEAVAAKVAGQASTIADLMAQIAAGSPVSQEQLDALKVEADGIVEALKAI